MSTFLLILILVGALISAVAAFRALGAYLRFRRTRAAFQGEVTDEVARLAARTARTPATRARAAPTRMRIRSTVLNSDLTVSRCCRPLQTAWRC